MEPNPIFDSLVDIYVSPYSTRHTANHRGDFPFANGVGPGNVLTYYWHDPEPIGYLDALKQSGVVIHPNEQPNVAADIAGLRRADEYTDDCAWVDQLEHPGTFTEHGGIIHANLFGDDFPEYRRRNRQRFGGDAAEDRYRPDSK